MTPGPHDRPTPGKHHKRKPNKKTAIFARTGHSNLPGGGGAMPEPGSGLVLFCPAAAGACLYYLEVLGFSPAPPVLRDGRPLVARASPPGWSPFSRSCHSSGMVALPLVSKPPPLSAQGAWSGPAPEFTVQSGSSAICRPPSSYYTAGGPLQGVWK